LLLSQEEKAQEINFHFVLASNLLSEKKKEPTPQAPPDGYSNCSCAPIKGPDPKGIHLLLKLYF
jgi:hypothetical protein